MSQILALYLDFEDANDIHVLKVLIWGFGGYWSSWLGLGIKILIPILWQVFDTFMFQMLALYLDFEDAKSVNVLYVRILGLETWSWFGYSYWSLIHWCYKHWLSILILKMQRPFLSFKSSFGALEDAGGSWLGFGILILILIWSLVLDIPMIQILALYLDFEGAKNIHVL